MAVFVISVATCVGIADAQTPTAPVESFAAAEAIRTAFRELHTWAHRVVFLLETPPPSPTQAPPITTRRARAQEVNRATSTSDAETTTAPRDESMRGQSGIELDDPYSLGFAPQPSIANAEHVVAALPSSSSHLDADPYVDPERSAPVSQRRDVVNNAPTARFAPAVDSDDPYL